MCVTLSSCVNSTQLAALGRNVFYTQLVTQSRRGYQSQVCFWRIRTDLHSHIGCNKLAPSVVRVARTQCNGPCGID